MQSGVLFTLGVHIGCGIQYQIFKLMMPRFLLSTEIE
ncbi:Uncharacterised protein [Vibrio cholerae]|nr:Uncharacterised protein [Vibrio cholerae]